MRDAQALYSMDPVRGRLVPQLVELLEATRADRCALVWSPIDGSAGPFPHIVVDAVRDEPRVTFGADLAARGLAAAFEGTVGTGRARPRKSLAYMIAAKHGRRWSLVLSGVRQLNLGRDVGQLFHESRYVAISVLIDTEDASLWDQRETTGTLFAQAEECEASGNYESALNLYEVAASACLAMGLAENGVRAAWYQARALRRLGRLEDALAAYKVAEGAARKLTDQSLAAAILTGRGSVHRMQGNMPLARTTYEEALRIAPPGALGIPLAYFGLMLVEQEVGSLAPAAKFGLLAYDAYPVDHVDRFGTLVVLGNVLLECGDLGAAEDAYEIVLGSGQRDIDVRATATSGLAQVAARRNDVETYRGATKILKSASASIQVEVWTQLLLDRARDELILRRADRARKAADEALRLAEAHKLGRLIFEADEIRAMVDNPEPTSHGSVVTGTKRVRGRLRVLRAMLP